MKKLSKKLTALCLTAALCCCTPMALTGCGGSSEDDASAAKGETTAPVEEESTGETTAPVEETTEQATQAEPVTMYTVANLTMRESGSTDASVITIIPIGSKVKAVETDDPKWFKVKYDGKKGYASADYLTKSKKKATKAKEDAEAAAAAAAEQAQQQAAQASDYNSGSSSSASGGKSVVSREKYDDCDGSGHGYEEITYSDGTTEIVEY